MAGKSHHVDLFFLEAYLHLYVFCISMNAQI